MKRIIQLIAALAVVAALTLWLDARAKRNQQSKETHAPTTQATR